ncbi:hypothetical protein PYCCODRAFT_1439851 [Trametes coccinea BRFM310]|uniref:Uncharacterized protein n=1 Tax=Trametes coccinea (strain BRFM310) TaxID=1353009 RepID=A0A1Y2ICX7_TRAC3|nr:hypothetical protein PYCCODRAFT_1439851 [Trametes coccinea BRFM310]
MHSALFPIFVTICWIACACATPVPAQVDRRETFTGRLFAHHAHERVGPTSALTAAVVQASPAGGSPMSGALEATSGGVQ